MFKDYDKYLSKSLQVYLFVLIIIFIMKIAGLDYFGLDVDNPLIVKIDNFCYKYNLTNIVYMITLYINIFVIYSISLQENSKKLRVYLLFVLLFYVFIKFAENAYIDTSFVVFIEFIYMYIMLKIYNKKVKFKRYFLISLLLIFYQCLTLFIRNINYVENNSFILNTILGIDYIILELISYELFKKGGIKLCGMEVHLSSLKRISLKKLLKRLQENWHKFRQLEKVEKLSLSIYIFLSLLWNTLSVVLILLVAKLNDTFIECIFILTSFWLSKGTFGKPFHLNSMLQCFIVSNLTYYTLNRVTTPIGISILIPIMLGVGLSYVTSKLVKKTYKPLYRGMSEELFEDTITKVVDKGSLKYKICYEFYINKKTDISLSIKYNYSVAGIRKIKDRINGKIKELNK